MISDPSDAAASPNGWHDEDHRTAGNNVRAGAVPSNTGLVHFAESANLTFRWPYTPDAEAPTEEAPQLAGVTQIFYTANKYHDLLYVLGFDEAAGNMQADNFGRGGKGNDNVDIRTQVYSGTNNGYFTQSKDGQRPSMTMFLFDKTDPGRDVVFDNGFIIHEYTHGCKNSGIPLHPFSAMSYPQDEHAEDSRC